MLLRKGILVPARQVVASMQGIAAENGLDFGELPMNYNSRIAQELGLWAQDKGYGPPFQASSFRAYFVAGENIADIEVLLRIVKDTGLDAAEAKSVIENSHYRDAVDNDWKDVCTMAIVAAPTYIIDGQRLVGAQPFARLEELAVRCGA